MAVQSGAGQDSLGAGEGADLWPGLVPLQVLAEARGSVEWLSTRGAQVLGLACRKENSRDALETLEITSPQPINCHFCH